jgi:hypothetical protein
MRPSLNPTSTSQKAFKTNWTRFSHDSVNNDAGLGHSGLKGDLQGPFRGIFHDDDDDDDAEFSGNGIVQQNGDSLSDSFSMDRFDDQQSIPNGESHSEIQGSSHHSSRSVHSGAGSGVLHKDSKTTTDNLSDSNGMSSCKNDADTSMAGLNSGKDAANEHAVDAFSHPQTPPKRPVRLTKPAPWPSLERRSDSLGFDSDFASDALDDNARGSAADKGSTGMKQDRAVTQNGSSANGDTDDFVSTAKGAVYF